MTELEILENKEIREKLIQRLDVLDKVKQVVTMPSTELITMEQVADYYEVDIKAIDTIINRHYDELSEDGYRVYTKSEIINLLNLQNEDLKDLKGKTVVAIGNQNIIIPNRGLRLFTRRALLRVGMLLRDSEIAKRIRTYLLDVEEKTDPDIALNTITEEERLLLEVIRAETPEQTAIALNKYRRYVERYKREAEILTKENQVLAKGIITWDLRQAINKMVRRMASVVYGGDFKKAWNKVYDEMLYKHNINVNARIAHRDKHLTLFDVLTTGEIKKALQTVTALCKVHGVDISDIVYKEG